MISALQRINESVTPVIRPNNNRYGISYFLFAAVFILGGPTRSNATAYGGMRAVMPIQSWGLLFLVAGFAWLFACYTHNRKAIAKVHLSVSVIQTFMAASFGLQAILYKNASFAGLVVFSLLAWGLLSTAGWISKESQP